MKTALSPSSSEVNVLVDKAGSQDHSAPIDHLTFFIVYRDVLIHLGGKMWVLFPWLGSYAFLAMERFLKIKCRERLGLKGLTSVRPYYIQFTMQVSKEKFFEILKEEAEKEFDTIDLVYPEEVPVFEKYDQYVPPELVRKGFAHGVLDIEGMKKRILGWKK